MDYFGFNKMMQLTSLCLILSATTIWARPQNQAPSSDTTPIPIINQTDTNDGNGTFSSSYESGNGIRFSQQGFVKQIPVAQLKSRGQFSDDSNSEGDGLVQVQTGSYSYTAPDGQVITLNYTADEDGFHPSGAHLPTPPPLPDYVEKLLADIQKQSAANQQQPLAGAQSFQNNVAIQNPQNPQQVEEYEPANNEFIIRVQ